MMITLKAVLVGSSCVGVLAVGGVTYASVAHPHARSDRPKAPDAKPALAAPAPARPACLPKEPGSAPHGLPKTDDKAGDVRGSLPKQSEAEQHAADARQGVAQQAQGAQQAQQAKKAPIEQPRSVDTSVPKPGVKPAPGEVPGSNCVPTDLPNGAKPAPPAKPDAPKLPQPERFSCDSMKPAIAMGGPAERSMIMSRGLGHGTKHVGVITYKGHKLCAVTEKWAGHADQWLKVERVQTPQPYSLDQLRQAMQLPAGGAPTNVYGQRGWQTPLGGGVFWYSEDGYAMCVSGSPAYATQLQDVASKLQQQAQQAR